MRKSSFKDMNPLRENDNTRTQHKKDRFALRDYSMNHRVEIILNLNEEAKREQIFKLRIDDKEVLLDVEEVQRAIRWC